jgi:DNA-binding MarR family transcriptional regulator
MMYNKYTGEIITDTQFLVLRSLRNKGPCNTSHLAQTLGVTLSAITALINRLFKQGLVSRERKADDRRQVWLSITPQGMNVLKEVEEKRHQMLAVLFSRLPENEREQLLNLLRKVVHLYELHNKGKLQ